MRTNRLRCRFLQFLSTTAIGLLAVLPTFAGTNTLDQAQRGRLARVRVPFVENCGQLDERVAFAAPTFFGTVFVTHEGELVYSLPKDEITVWTLTETFVAEKPQPTAGPRAVTGVSYFHGNDPEHWRSNLPTYEEVRLGEVWRGVSVSLRAHGGNVEKVFTLQPGAKVDKIQLRLDGASSLRIDKGGSLVAAIGNGEIHFTAPLGYQEEDGVRRPVKAVYALHGSRYGFRLGSYDHALPVVVDPLLQSTYLGGTDPYNGDEAEDIAVHPLTGDVLVAGWTYSSDFPGTAGGAQPPYGGGIADAFVARLNPTLTTLLQATYLGGTNGDGALGIAIYPTTGEVFVSGFTYSTDFPGTTGGAQPSYGGGYNDRFVARLNSTLTALLQSTYLGGSGSDGSDGSDGGRISVHPTSGEVLVTGYTQSTDFPGTAGGAQPSYGGGYTDGFVARFNATLTTLLQATYLGGTDGDWITGIAIDQTTGEVLVTGQTSSANFPGTPGGAQPSFGGGYVDGFVARLSPTLTTLLQATYLGGSGGDSASAVTNHSSTGEVFVAGNTASADFPGTAGGAQPTGGGFWGNAFVARLNPALTALVQATYLGGDGGAAITSIAIHPSSGEVLVAGSASTNFPGMTGGALPPPSPLDGFVARLDMTLTSILQATCMGVGSAIAIDPSSGEVLITGSTHSAGFPGTAGGAQPALAGDGDAFVARLTPDLAAILSPAGLAVDPVADPGDGDFVFEPGETVPVTTLWKNLSSDPVTANGQASELTGPVGAAYMIVVDTAIYGTIAPGATQPCSNCYLMLISTPTWRPATHWDATFTEALDVPQVFPHVWTLHVGDSFTDTPRSSSFYRFVENILHHGITSGCGDGNFCPDTEVTRAQMAVFLLRASHFPNYRPVAATGIFLDVPRDSFAADWIEDIYNRGITAGCSTSPLLYCPDNPVSRAQVAVFLLTSSQGPTYKPPACAGIFEDVVCTPGVGFGDWIEDLYNRGITAGCSTRPLLYCPDTPVTRGQMAVFLVTTFGLLLYGP